MKFLDNFSQKHPRGFGSLLAIIGVLILTPDTMVMRFSNLERWSLMGWRGLLMGITLFVIWYFFFKSESLKKLSSLFSWQGIVFIFAFAINSICFTLGIIETSVMVVLTAVATMPIFAAILSIFIMKEFQGWICWLTILSAMLGVVIVVSDGNNAIGQPEGSVVLGAIFGLSTAICLALTFTLVRKFPEISVMPACSIGAIISGIIGFALSKDSELFNTPIWTIICMGIIILPLSFTFLLIAPRYTSSAIVSLIMLLEMVIGPFWVWYGVGEKPSLLMIFGSLLVVIVIIFHIAISQFKNIN